MVSYLVMKNNIKRLFQKKSTYLLMVLIPVVLIFTGSLSVRMEDKQFRVGILGSNAYVISMAEQLEGMENVQYEVADEKTINTDQIMGKYHIILDENKGDSGLTKLEKVSKKGTNKEMVLLSARQRMASMLLTIYMIVATLYGMKFLQDKREGVVERVMFSGGTRCSYLMGCFLSSTIVTGIQLVIILPGWSLFDHNFTFSTVEIVQLFLFTLMISNLYGILISMISKSEMMAGILGSSVAAVCSILGGTFVAIDKMPEIVQYLSVLSPIRWLMEWM